jgi:hypothetical protein
VRHPQAGIGDRDPRGFLRANVVVMRNRASAMVGCYTSWGPHGGAHENRCHGLFFMCGTVKVPSLVLAN